MIAQKNKIIYTLLYPYLVNLINFNVIINTNMFRDINFKIILVLKLNFIHYMGILSININFYLLYKFISNILH